MKNKKSVPIAECLEICSDMSYYKLLMENINENITSEKISLIVSKACFFSKRYDNHSCNNCDELFDVILEMGDYEFSNDDCAKIVHYMPLNLINKFNKKILTV